jgi:FPC/CPF motif-containing protein YcgG
MEVSMAQRDRDGDHEVALRVFRQIVGAHDYPCLGARSVLNRDRATVRGYRGLGTVESARELLADLAVFAERTDLTEGFASFVAVFDDRIEPDERTFERLLWRQLAAMRAVDPAPWDPRVSTDPADPDFAFSANGTAYFVVGLHPGASRPARRAPSPVLVFNPHEQFERLRAAGSYGRMRDTIRRRDLTANGSVNPMLSDHGQISEARQYSGRRVGENWTAPFPAATRAVRPVSGGAAPGPSDRRRAAVPAQRSARH